MPATRVFTCEAFTMEKHELHQGQVEVRERSAHPVSTHHPYCHQPRITRKTFSQGANIFRDHVTNTVKVVVNPPISSFSPYRGQHRTDQPTPNLKPQEEEEEEEDTSFRTAPFPTFSASDDNYNEEDAASDAEEDTVWKWDPHLSFDPDGEWEIDWND